MKPIIRYKLTTQSLTTHNDFQWKLNKEVTTSGIGEMCSDGWLHCYSHPLLAVLLNPIHANIKNPRLYECEVSGESKSDKLKEAYTHMTIIKRIKLPKLTTNQRVAFAILMGKLVYKDKKWNKWANDWLSDKDRSDAAAYAAANAAVAAYAAAYAADAAYAAAADAAAADAAAVTTKKLIIIAKRALKYK
jgi:hypothetical protein